MTVQTRKTNRFIVGIIVIFSLVVIGSVVAKNAQPAKKSALAGMTAIVFRSPICGCCANYINYLRQYGVTVEEKLESNMGIIKINHNIPGELTSCHTTEIGGYTVEGHVPVEAIEKLVSEKPNVAGIGMAGMPAGSPGMPGAKVGSFEISEFSTTGSVALFVIL